MLNRNQIKVKIKIKSRSKLSNWPKRRSSSFPKLRGKIRYPLANSINPAHVRSIKSKSKIESHKFTLMHKHLPKILCTFFEVNSSAFVRVHPRPTVLSEVSSDK